MSYQVVYMVFCPRCDALMQIETVATEWVDGRPITWEHRCERCGQKCGFIFDGGEVDLALVREDVLNSFNDFEVFTERPWETP